MQNNLRVLENVDLLINLKRLVISHNKLEEITNLLDLKKLEYLDLSFNMLVDFNASLLPSSLKSILIEGNPLKDRRAFIEYLLDRLPYLTFIDGIRVREIPRKDFKPDQLEKPLARIEDKLLSAKFEESTRETLKDRELLLASAKNSTKDIIGQSFAASQIDTPMTTAKEAADNMRYKFLLEHTVFKTNFEDRLKPFEDRHPNHKYDFMGAKK